MVGKDQNYPIICLSSIDTLNIQVVEHLHPLYTLTIQGKYQTQPKALGGGTHLPYKASIKHAQVIFSTHWLYGEEKSHQDQLVGRMHTRVYYVGEDTHLP